MTEAAQAAADEGRLPLSRQRVLDAAVALADRDGIDALTMRRLAQELGVEAMSLYHHVANKDAILDGVIDVVLEEVNEVVAEHDVAAAVEDWQGTLRRRILAARTVMLRHRWAPRLLETRTRMSPPIIGYYDGVLAVLRAGGFSWDLAHHAMHALGSRALGFTQELFDPDEPSDDGATAADSVAMLEAMADRFPHLVGMMAAIVHDDPDTTLGWCDDQTEFEFGLDIVLDGLERHRRAGTY